MKHKFTLKQLYGYSIMNWRQFYDRLYEIEEDRDCSFCIDADYDCFHCSIDDDICDLDEDGSSEDTLYDKIHTATVSLKMSIDKIIDALRKKYEEEEDE